MACQVMVPEDGDYLVQSDRDDSKFWAWKDSAGFGCDFFGSHSMPLKTLPEDFQGFQSLPLGLRGRVRDSNSTCAWDFALDPECGWGDALSPQRSTAGWLARYGVFSPHWQITHAIARATGFVEIGERRYDFQQEPLYAEKNWGGSFPRKWYWAQCNSFAGEKRLSVTAGGGIRRLLFGMWEEVGLLCVHHDGIFLRGGALDQSGYVERGAVGVLDHDGKMREGE